MSWPVTCAVPPNSEEKLYLLLQELGIAVETHEHEAVFTVAESGPVKGSLPGAHSKNLFLRDKKGRVFLITAKDDTAIDLKRLHATVGASGRLSFGSAERLGELLGVKPGSVTPFGAINDLGGQVTVVVDARLMEHSIANFHPLRNTATTAIRPDDLVRFLRRTGHEPLVVALPAPASDELPSP